MCHLRGDCRSDSMVIIMVDLPKAEPKEEQLLQLAIVYMTTSVYPAGISKDNKRAVDRKAGKLVIGKRTVFL